LVIPQLLLAIDGLWEDGLPGDPACLEFPTL
jgi:hypothetical protein